MVEIQERPVPGEPMVSPPTSYLHLYPLLHLFYRPSERTVLNPTLTSHPPRQYIIANLGMSYNFGPIDLDHLPFPVHMRVDYIRVYQPSNARNVGCDPPDFPTADYINRHIEAYTNPNLTTWVDDYGQVWPGNSFLGQCPSD